MTDVYLAASARDLPRLQPLVARLTELKLSVGLAPRPDLDSPQRISGHLAAARAVLVVWSKHSCEEQPVLQAAAHGHRLRNLIALRLEACTPPIQFLRVATLEAAPALANPQHLVWVQMIRQIEALVGRPGLSSFDRTAALRNSDGLVAWAAAHRNDPLAEEALRLAALIREEAAARRAREEAELATARNALRRGRIARALDRHGLALGLGAMGVAGVACAALLYAALGRPQGELTFEGPSADPTSRAVAATTTSVAAGAEARRKQQAEQYRQEAAKRGLAGARQYGAAGADGTSGNSGAGGSASRADRAASFEDEPLLDAALTSSRHAERRADSAARIAATMAKRADDGESGYGTVAFPDGGVYRGQTADGRPSGFGVRTDPPSAGGAEFSGMIDGSFGQTVWPDGARFAGYHKAGRPNGPGTLKLPDGRSYEGGFNGGERSGVGAMWSASGELLAAGRWEGDQLAEARQP